MRPTRARSNHRPILARTTTVQPTDRPSDRPTDRPTDRQASGVGTDSRCGEQCRYRRARWRAVSMPTNDVDASRHGPTLADADLCRQRQDRPSRSIVAGGLRDAVAVPRVAFRPRDESSRCPRRRPRLIPPLRAPQAERGRARQLETAGDYSRLLSRRLETCREGGPFGWQLSESSYGS